MQEKQILKAISALEKRVVDLYHRVRAGVGIQGPQGVQGPLGPPGPVGPAGLEWQGQWVSGTSYIADDAVGYNGASYFCILATSGTTNPSVDTTHWALLASQGAIGPAGAQGPTGNQGPIGPVGPAGTSAPNNFNFKGQWDFTGNTPYVVGDVVTTFTYDNTFQYQMFGSYICTTDNSGAINPGISNDWAQLGLTQIAKGTRLKGAGTATSPITLKGYRRSGYIYATGTNNPQRSVNFFNGMELPTGVTESFVRVSTGSYELRYTALIGNTFVDNIGLGNYVEYSFSMNANIVYGGSFTTTSGGNQTFVIGFQNKPAGVLTDGFSTVNYKMEWFE
jgi:hypothetical protein